MLGQRAPHHAHLSEGTRTRTRGGQGQWWPQGILGSPMSCLAAAAVAMAAMAAMAAVVMVAAMARWRGAHAAARHEVAARREDRGEWVESWRRDAARTS